MQLPAAVLRQAEQSDALLKQMNEAQNAPAPSEPTNAQVDTPTPETPAETTTLETSVVNDAKRIDWKQKYSVLQGKYNAEVPMLHGQLRALSAENESLKSKLTATQEATKATTPAEQINVDEFDPTLVRYINAEARKIADSIVAEKLGPMEQRIEGTEAENAQRARINFENDLDDLVFDSHGVDWRDVNTEAGFIDYCKSIDRFTGAARQVALNDAVKSGSADRVAAFFQAYLETKPKTAQPRTVVAAPDPRAALVTPSRSAAGSGTHVSDSKPSYSRAEIATFYTNYAKAQINKGTPPDVMARMKATDLDITEAQRDGRIRD